MTRRDRLVRYSRSLAPFLFLFSLSALNLSASVIVQYVVYLDENSRQAFYLGSPPQRTGCNPDPFGIQFQCTLNIANDQNGVPTVLFPVPAGVRPGDVSLIEYNSTVPDGVVRFAEASAELFSGPSDLGSIPTTPNPDAVQVQEADLSTLHIALSDDPQHDLTLQGLLRGKVGAFYAVSQTDIGGTLKAPRGIGFIFIDSGDPVGITGGQNSPEPQMMGPVVCWIAFFWAGRRRFRRG